MAEDKTNVMRILEQRGVPYLPHSYPHGKEAVDAVTVASMLGLPQERIYKTLVTHASSGGCCVFVIPAGGTLDLKKAARAAGEKSVEMIHVSELQKLTGYIRGGCSPIGMKKAYRTTFDERILSFPTIMVSGGKIGTQVELSPDDLLKLTRGFTAAIAQ